VVHLQFLAYKGRGSYGRIILAVVKDDCHRAIGFQVEPQKGDCIGADDCANIHGALTCYPSENSISLYDDSLFDFRQRKYFELDNKRWDGRSYKWEITDREFIELMFLLASTSMEAIKRIRQNHGIKVVVTPEEFVCTKHSRANSCRCIKRNRRKLEAAQKFLAQM
jgi:hypothetical protein